MPVAVHSASGSLSSAMGIPEAEHCASFQLSLGTYISGRSLVLADDEDVLVDFYCFSCDVFYSRIDPKFDVFACVVFDNRREGGYYFTSMCQVRVG